MGIRCSLTGHSWGDTETEVRRDEREDEIAITEIEFEICDRCDETRVVNKNTEVRAIEPEEPDTDAGDSDDSDGSRETETDGVEAAADFARNAFGGSGSEPEGTDDSGGFDDAVEIEDDAVIMDDDSETRDPEVADVSDVSGVSDADLDASEVDETEDETLEEPDAEEIDTDEDVEVETGDDDSLTDEELTQRRREVEGTEVSRVEPQEDDSGEKIYVCTDCGFESEELKESLRPGDICPDCGKGYIEERTVEE
ncbi:MAG: hypothetical protein SV760_06310 [Halobacteria archaeon]|nr:hypothetical protein [Halobacteria archaeon]